ncbi:MAG: hypothetical protein KIS66_17305 [Fimbriimonadaceae bacterium]|nr:hypothetical protein [Fimbriimonadaceae bacterium]
MDREVFSTKEFQSLAKHFVFVKINADDNPNLKNAYGVIGLPTGIIMDKTGSVIHKMVGYQPAPAFIGELKGLIK